MNKSISVIAFAVIMSVLMAILPKPALAQTIFAIDDDLEKYWLADIKVAPDYPMEALRSGTEGCAAVGFFIQPDGSTGNLKVVAIHPSGIFANSALDAAKKFKFVPSEQKPEKIKVLTINTFVYQIMTQNDKRDDRRFEQLYETCKSEALELLQAGTSKS